MRRRIAETLFVFNAARTFSAAACLVLAISGPTLAGNHTWLGGGVGGTDNWGDLSNWAGPIPPNQQSSGVHTHVFMKGSGSSDLAQLNNAHAIWEIDTLTFDSGATGTLTLEGGTLSLGNTFAQISDVMRITNSDNNTHRFNNQQVDIRHSKVTFDADTADLDFNTDVHFRWNTAVLTTTGGNDIYFDDGLTGESFVTSATLEIFGGTTVHIGGSSSVITDVVLSSGSLQLDSNSNLGSNTDITMLSGTTFNVNGYTENVDIVSGDGTISLGSGSLTLGDAADFTFSGSITGSGNITKNQGGVMTLSGSSSYTGATSITGGTLRLSGSGSLSSSTDVSVSSNGTLDLNGVSDTVDSISGSGTVRLGGAQLEVDATSGDEIFSGDILESGTLRKGGAHSLTLSGDNEFTSLIITGGDVSVSSSSNLGDDEGSLLLGSGTLNVEGSFTNSRLIYLANGTIDVASGRTLTQSGLIRNNTTTASLTKNGAGTLKLNTDNTYTGDTILNAGRLEITGGSEQISNSSDLVINGGVFDLNNLTETVSGLDGNGGEIVTGGSSGHLIVNQSENRSYDGVISGSGKLTKQGNGILTLTGNHSYTGNTSVQDGTLALGTGSELSNSTDVSVNSGATFDLNGNGVTVATIAGAGNIKLGGAGLNVVQDGGATEFSGVISEGGGISKSGTHSLILSGNNSFTGDVAIFDGAISVATDNNLGDASGDIVLAANGTLQTTGSFVTSREIRLGPGAAGTIDTAAGTTLTHAGSMSGGTSGATLQKAGDGRYKITSPVSGFTGDFVLEDGTFEIADFSGDAINNGSRITINGEATLENHQLELIGSLAGSGNVVLTDSLEFGSDNTSTTYSGVISGDVGSGRVRKTGTGTMTITQSQTYLGDTRITGGTLKLGNNGGLPDTSDVLVDATWDLNKEDDTIDALTGSGNVLLGTGTLTVGGNNGSGTFAGVISEGSIFSTSLIKVGSGTQTLTGNNSYTNTTSIEGGTLQITTSDNLGIGSIRFRNGARLQVNGTTTNSRAVNVDTGGGGVISVGSGHVVTQSGVVQGVGSLEKADVGTLLLTADNDYQGSTNVTGGTLRLSGAGRLPDSSDVSVESGTTFDLNGISDTVNSLAGAGFVHLGGGTLTVNDDSNSRTFSGVISESGAVVKDGSHTWELSGANTFSGPLFVFDGVLSVSSDSHLGDPANSVTLDEGTLRATTGFGTGREIRLIPNQGTIEVSSGQFTANGVISGSGTLVKTGPGSIYLGANNTYTGGTVVQNGSVEVAGNAGLGANAGTLTLATGTLVLDDEFTNLHPIVLSGSGAIDTKNQLHTVALPITGLGTLTKFGTGELELAAGATHMGHTAIEEGTLLTGGGLPDLYDVELGDPSATWQLGVSDTIDALTGDGTVKLSGNTLTLGGGDEGDFFEGTLQGPGGLVLIGPGTHMLGGNNSHSSTDINEATLVVSQNTNLGAGGAPIGFDEGTLRTTATFTMPRDVTLNALGGTFNVDGGTTLTVANPVTGPGGLTKRGTGTLILQANNNFGEPMTVLDGLVQIDTGMTFGGLAGNGNLAIGLNELIINNTGDDIYGGIISGNGGKLTKDGPGTLTLTGINTYTGGTCILDGVLRISQTENLGEIGSLITFDGGMLNTTASFSMGRPIELNAGGGTIDVDAATLLNESGNITGEGSLTKIGGGTLQLSGILSSYQGGTHILEGEVSIGSNVNLGSSAGPLTLDNGSLHTSANVLMARSTTIGPGGGSFRTDAGTSLMHSGAIAGNPGAAGLTKRGLGDLQLAGNNTFTGNIFIEEGRLRVDSTGQLGDTSNLLQMRGGTLGTLADMTNDRVIQLEDGPTANTIEVAEGSTLNQSGVISDGPVGPSQSLRKSGAGTLVLTSPNSYTSPTQIEAGTVRLAGSGQLPDVTDVTVAAGSTFDLNNVDDSIDALAGNGNITLGTATLTIGADHGGGSFSGIISGNGSVAKSGTGTQSLRTREIGEEQFPNTYTGGTVINGGVLDVETDTNLGDPTGGLSFDGGTLRVAGAEASVDTMRLVTLNADGGAVDVGDMSSVRFANVVGGVGSMTKEGPGVLTYSAANTYSGDTIVNGGDLRLEGSGRISDVSSLIVNAPGVFDLNSIDDAVNGLSGNGQVILGTGRLTMGAGGVDGTHTGVISGDGGVRKVGAGTQILSGDNTFLGGTNLDAGVLQVALNENLGDFSGALAFDGGTLRTAGTFAIARNPVLAAGGGSIDTVLGTTLTTVAPFTGVGGLTKLGGGTLQMGGASSYTGATVINAGVLELTDAERLSSATDVTLVAGATLMLANNESIDALSGAGTVEILAEFAALNVGADNGSGSFSGAIVGAGNLLKAGNGVQTLSGSNTYSGTTLVDGGELVLTGGGQIDQSTTILGFNIGSDGTATVEGSGTTWDLTGDLQVGLRGLGRMNIEDDAVMSVEGLITVGSNEQGPNSAGVLSFDGGTLDNTGGNGIDVINGRLQGSGTIIANVDNLATVAPGNSAGILEITGNFIQTLGARLAIEIGGNDNSNPDTPQFDVLNVNGSLAIDGLLDVALINGFAPSATDTFPIATATALAGIFSNVPSGSRVDLSSGGTGSFQVDYGPGSPFGANLIVLSDFQGSASLGGDFDGDGMLEGDDIDSLVMAIASDMNDLAFDLTGDGLVNLADRNEWLAIAGAANLTSGNPYQIGDATLDGVVDGQDFIEWNNNKFTSLAAWTGGDFNADGVVDGQDFIEWNNNKFTSVNQGNLGVVPEPSASCVWFSALICLVVSCRRRRRR